MTESPGRSRQAEVPVAFRGPALPRRGRRPARRDRVRRDLGVRAARRGRQAGADAGGQGRDRDDGHRGVRPRRPAARPARASSGPTRSRRWRRSATPIDLFHEHTAPSDWFEGLIKAYVGDGLANDFYREIAAYLDPDTRDLVIAVARGRRALRVRRRPGAGGDRGRPPPRRPAGAVGPPADGGGADPGPAGGRRAGRALRACSPAASTGPASTSPRSGGCSPGSPSGTPSGWPSSGSTA